MDDLREIQQVAEQLIAWRGDGAYAYAREQAEISRGIGDQESATTWLDIALGIVEIESGSLVDPGSKRAA